MTGSPSRIVVVGTSGSGKTTLARRISETLGVPHVELDALYHGPGWVERDRLEFRRLLEERLDASPDGWVACGNYSSQLEYEHWHRAEMIVWLDLPRRLVMARVLRRTLLRVITRKELWNGNRESLSNFWHRDGIVRWAWSTHARRHRRYTEMSESHVWQHLTWVRLRSRREVKNWLAGLAADRPSA